MYTSMSYRKSLLALVFSGIQHQTTIFAKYPLGESPVISGIPSLSITMKKPNLGVIDTWGLCAVGMLQGPWTWGLHSDHVHSCCGMLSDTQPS